MKKLILALAVLGVLAAILIALVVVKGHSFATMAAAGAHQQMPPQAVSTTVAQAEVWNPTLQAVGSLTAEQGVTLAAEVSGVLSRIDFESGAKVAQGTVLAQLDVSVEEAQLKASEARAELARLNAARVRQLRSSDTLAQSDWDAADAQLKQASADVEALRAMIARKTLRAPFTGRLGIRQASLGQYLNNGNPVVTLEALDPIHVDFTLPQQRLAELAEGQTVRVTADAAPGKTYEGKITALDSRIDPATRNVRVRATLANTGELLRSGMFAKVEVVLPAGAPQVIVPVGAVNYSPSGNTIFIVETKNGPDGHPAKTVRQEVVRLGAQRGDFVAVVAGVKAGEEIVTVGGFKLRNGGAVLVNNSLAPKPELAPKPANS